jgi:WD40 repeat protein/tRNA A-37 threonylcarbamoyl transferase component Bud32
VAVEVPGYEILGELGRGGMGVVYRARQVKANRLVALKMILAGGHASTADLRRFQAEAEAVAKLQHPNIVQVFEVGEHDGRPFFSLEYCTGGSLAHKLGGTPLTPAEAARLVEALARATQVAHEARVVHRDLKPANVLLAADGTPKITDFGLARKLDEAGQTASGAVLGTPSYMAPEQAGGKAKEVGPGADVYALGAILYECLTGRPPFRAATALDTIMQVVADESVPPSRLNPKVPHDLETVCLKCLRKEPAKRYASAEALAGDLRRWQAGEPITARPAGRLERAWKWCRRRPAAAALLAVSVAALLVLTAVVAGFLKTLSQKNRFLAQERDRASTEADNARRALERVRRGAMTTQLFHVAATYRENPLHALELLNDPDACPADLRDDFAWRYYSAQCRRWRLRWEWPEEAIDALAVSPDGRLLATSTKTVITLWELNTGEKLATLKGHALTVTRLAFSPDSRVLASVGEREWGRREAEAEVKVWDVAAKTPCWARPAGAENVGALSFSGDGRALAAGASSDRGTRVWEAATGRELAHLPKLGPNAALSPDGKLIVGEARLLPPPPQPPRPPLPPEGKPIQAPGRPQPGAAALCLEVWDVAEKRLVRRLTLPERAQRTSGLAFTAGGEGVAALVNGWDLRLWDLQTGKSQSLRSRVPPLMTAVGFKNRGWDERLLARSPDGKSLAALVSLVNVAVWDVEGRQEQVVIQPRPGQPGEVKAVSFTNEGKALAVVRREQTGTLLTLRVWSLAPAESVFLPDARGVAFLPDGALVTAVGDKLKRIDPDTGRAEVLAEGLPGQPAVFAASPDGKALVFSSMTDEKTGARGLTFWDVAARRARFTCAGEPWSLRFSPDGARVIVWDNGQTVRPLNGAPVVVREKGLRLFDARTGEETGRLSAPRDEGVLAAFAPDGREVAVGDGTTLRLLDVRTGEELRALDRPLLPICYIPNGELLFAARFDKKKEKNATLLLWDLRNDREHLRLGPLQKAPWFALAPDGKALAVAGGGEVEVWDLTTGQARLRLPGPAGDAMTAFGPDGRFLACDTEDGVRLWDTRPVEEKVIRPGVAAPPR